MSRTVAVEQRGSVALVSLTRGVNNAVDPALVDQLGRTLDELRGDDSVRALVLGSRSGKLFSIGLDIPALLDLDRGEMRSFFRSFIGVCLKLYCFPKPTVAAVERHAVAGGLILTLCCDYRFVAEGRTLMGIATNRLGVPVPHIAGLLLVEIVGARSARDLLDGGEFLEAADSLRLGLADRVLVRDEVLPSAIASAASLGDLPAAAFAATKAQRVEPISAIVREQLETRAERFVSCWFSPEARERLGAAREKF